MFPDLNGSGIYLAGLGVAISACFVAILWLVRRDGHALPRVVGYLVILLVGSLATTKVSSFIFRGGVGTLSDELQGGMRYPGSIVGLLLFGWLARGLLPQTLSAARMGDLAAPGYMFALAIGRLNCFVVGCCHGAVCSMPWAIRFPKGSAAWFEQLRAGVISRNAAFSAPVHPFEFYLFGMEVSLALLSLWLQREKKWDGQILWAILALHSFSKTGIEFFRSPYSPFHQIVFVLGLFAVYMFLVSRRAADQAAAGTPIPPLAT